GLACHRHCCKCRNGAQWRKFRFSKSPNRKHQYATLALSRLFTTALTASLTTASFALRASPLPVRLIMPKLRFFTLLLVVALLSASLLPVCWHDSKGRQAVTGSVMFDDAPLKTGNISFSPTEGQATSGGAVIFNGKYSVPRDNGLLAGKYRVTI